MDPIPRCLAASRISVSYETEDSKPRQRKSAGFLLFRALCAMLAFALQSGQGLRAH